MISLKKPEGSLGAGAVVAAPLGAGADIFAGLKKIDVVFQRLLVLFLGSLFVMVISRHTW